VSPRLQPGRLILLVAVLGLVSCAPSYTLVANPPDPLLVEETFQFRKWVRPGVEPDTAVIGIHGFNGASIDYENLALHLIREQPRSAVYAYEVRGQGKDPKLERRGDIDHPGNWSRDLLRFTELVRARHPEARIVWLGESMGGLILTRTYREELAAGREPPVDALAISSPVVKFPDDFPAWKKGLVRGLAQLAPGIRVPLDTISGGEAVPMTHDTNHADQSETNQWHVEKHTLRLLASLGDMIEAMPDWAASFEVPTLVLHGGKDFFSEPEDIRDFVGRIPDDTPRIRRFYPEGHHLLMYDKVRDEVIDDIASWLDSLRQG